MRQWEKPTYEKALGKWETRAATYETILVEEGVLEAEKYISRYLPKIDRLLDALWKLHLLREKDARKRARSQ